MYLDIILEVVPHDFYYIHSRLLVIQVTFDMSVNISSSSLPLSPIPNDTSLYRTIIDIICRIQLIIKRIVIMSLCKQYEFIPLRFHIMFLRIAPSSLLIGTVLAIYSYSRSRTKTKKKKRRNYKIYVS